MSSYLIDIFGPSLHLNIFEYIFCYFLWSCYFKRLACSSSFLKSVLFGSREQRWVNVAIALSYSSTKYWHLPRKKSAFGWFGAMSLICSVMAITDWYSFILNLQTQRLVKQVSLRACSSVMVFLNSSDSASSRKKLLSTSPKLKYPFTF